ncbi:MAG TPA: type II toxin-antitoxin system death-on-curing family toxin [Thermohalobaculum sp.]|nr:type II toxin-antitoxin system death-on-curing family toxin [Thermohalobaculum sp.]
MTEPRWLGQRIIVAVHDAQLVRHGGAGGIRDAGLLDSALARPLNLQAYGEDDLCVLAAAYAAGIVRNHPFVDGNKRTAFIAAALFLQENGQRLVAPQGEAVVMTLGLASGELPEAGFAAWLRDRTEAL